MSFVERIQKGMANLFFFFVASPYSREVWVKILSGFDLGGSLSFGELGLGSFPAPCTAARERDQSNGKGSNVAFGAME